MAVKIAYLLLALAATCSGTGPQKFGTDDSLSGLVEGTSSHNVVPEPRVKLVPLIRSQRSVDFNQIHTHVGSGFRRNFRRSGASGQFGQAGSSPRNGFVNSGYSGGFNNAGQYGNNQGASVPNGFVGSVNQGYGHTGGFRNPLNPGGFRSPISPSGFMPVGGFRNQVNPVGFVPGGIRPSGFINAVNPGGNMPGGIQQGGFRNPINPVGFVPRGIQPGGFRNPINPSGFVPGSVPQARFGNAEYAPGFNNRLGNRNQQPHAMNNGGIAGQGQGMEIYPDGSVGVRVSAVNETDEGTVHTVVNVVVVPHKEQNNGLQNRRNQEHGNQTPLLEHKKIVTEAQKILDGILKKPENEEPESAAQRVVEKDIE
ncbi:uncharacterized protein LOC111348319 [Spodoptera litura]|uniref:Uncharacterized protein LOC111348319 n=1 Tax=Spodoptera litura TaxID=69820 RepID=A0A9J7DR42_SPOLT|nr:uncharacterized protein LOC111348319 [Spodoptera litura]